MMVWLVKIHMYMRSKYREAYKKIEFKLNNGIDSRFEIYIGDKDIFLSMEKEIPIIKIYRAIINNVYYTQILINNKHAEILSHDTVKLMSLIHFIVAYGNKLYLNNYDLNTCDIISIIATIDELDYIHLMKLQEVITDILIYIERNEDISHENNILSPIYEEALKYINLRIKYFTTMIIEPSTCIN